MANKPSWVQDPTNPSRYTYTDTDGSVYESVSNGDDYDATEGIEQDSVDADPTPQPTQAQPTWVQDPKNKNRYTYTDVDGSVYESVSGEKNTPAQSQTKAPAAKAPVSDIDQASGFVPKTQEEMTAAGQQSVFGSRLENLGGIELSKENADALGGKSSPLYNYANGLAMALTGGQAVAETAAEGVDDLFDKTGLADLAPSGSKLHPGEMAMALAEAFPAGGVEAGIAPHASVAAPVVDADTAFALKTKEMIKAGATKDDLNAFAQANGKVPFGDDLDAVLKARDTNRPWDAVAPYRKQSEEKAVKAAQKANPDDVAGALKDAGHDPAILEKQPFASMKDRPAQKAAARVDDIKSRVDVLTEDWTNKPDFEVVHSIDDIADPVVRDSAKAAGDDALGFLGPDGKVRLISDNIKTPEELHAVVYHEALGHYGLSQKFGDDLTSLLNDFYENGSGDFRGKVDDWIQKNPDYYKGQENPHLLAAEEVLAEMSERGSIPAEFKDRLINQVKSYGRDLGINLKYSDREIGTILGMSHDAVINGFGRDVSANGFRFARAYHGTGDDFSEYDVSKAGEYGSEKGVVYFDSNPKNADTYAENSITRGGSSEDVKPLFDRLQKLDTEYPDWKNMPESVSKEYDKIETRIANVIDGVGENNQNIRPVDIDVPKEDMLVVDAKNGRILKDVREASIRKAKAEGKKGVVFKNAIDTSTSELRGGGKVEPSDVYAMFDPNKDTKPGFGPDNGIRYSRRRPEAANDDYQKLSDPSAIPDQPKSGASTSEYADYFRAYARHLEHKAVVWDQRGKPENAANSRQLAEKFREDAAFKAAQALKEQSPKYMRRRRAPGDTEEPTGAMLSGNINLDRIQTVRDVSGILDDLEKKAPLSPGKTFDVTKQEARDLNLNPAKVGKDTKGVGNLSAKLYAYRQVQSDVLDRVAELSEKLDQNYNEADHANYLKKLSQLEVVRARVSNDTAEIGRALSSLRIVAQSNARSSQILEALAKSGLSMSSLADKDVFMRFMKNVQALQQSGNPQGAAALMTKIVKPYWEDYLLSGRHSLMLSGMGTHLKNMKDNLNMIGREYIEAAVTVPFGGVAKEEMAARSYGLIRAALDSTTYKDTWQAFKDGVGNTSLNTKTELEAARIPGLSKVGDALNAEDTFFRRYMETSNLYAVGVREARRQGFKGKQLFAQGTHYAQNPTEAMLKEAREMADVALLVSEPSKLAKAIEAGKARKIDMTAGERTARFIAHLAFPFLRTTENLLFQSIRRSPLSFMDGVTRADFMAGGERRATAVSRTLLGSTIIGYYIYAADKGETTGDDKDYKKVASLEPGGYRPNSVKIEEGPPSILNRVTGGMLGDDGKAKYTDATALNTSFPNPFGLDNATAANVATLVNTYKGMIKAGESIGSAFASTIRSFVKVMGAASFADNLRPYIDLMNARPEEGGKIGGAIGGLASQFTPALARQVNNAEIDTKKRDYTGDRSVGDRVLGRIESGIPGLSDNYPIRYDIYGQEVEKGAKLTGIDAESKRPTDPTVKEMIRVEETLDKPVVTAAPRNLQIEGMKTTLTGENYAFFQKTVGENLRAIMKEVIGLPGYKKLSDKDKRQVLREAQTEARKDAKAAVVSRLSESDFKDVNEDK